MSAVQLRLLPIGILISGIVALLAQPSLSNLIPGRLVENPCSNGVWAWRPAAIASLHESHTPYIFQGLFFVANGREQYQFQGVKPFRVQESSCDLVLTYRFDDLVPVEMVAARFRVHRRVWQDELNRVAGLQVDFDSPSAGLGAYAEWLHDLRNVLRNETAVSITGLPDWLVSAPPQELQALASQADFIAFMMYRGTTPVQAPSSYYTVLGKSDMRFKLGLLPTQDRDQQIAQVRDAPGYLGTSIFITK